jgi:signal transduction histidine kinase
VRTRIISLGVLAAVLTIVLFGVPLALGALQYVLAHERSDLERLANETAVAVAADLFRDQRVEEALGGDASRVGVYQGTGRRVGGVGPATADAEVTEALDGGVGSGVRDGFLVLAVPVTHDGDVIGAVRAASPRSDALNQVAIVWLGMILLAGLVIVAVWVVARRQARRLARPLEELSAAARRLGEGDFSIRTLPAGAAEIDSLGSALNTTAERLDDLVARERAFSADASHQLRTPLTALRWELEVAMDQPDQDAQRAMRAAIAAADRLERTIDELLALARDAVDPRREPLDIAGLLDEIDQGWQERLATQGRQLILQVDEQAPSSAASNAAVRQALRVLVDNAEKHGSGTVTIAVRNATGALAIDVSDEGTGVARPSELFVRRPSNGHGIGLALARRLVEAEGGRLQLSQRAPARFTVLLLAMPAEAAAENRQPDGGQFRV